MTTFAQKREPSLRTRQPSSSKRPSVVARRLRERKRSPEPLIVAVTGFGKADDAVGTREAGFDMHLVKPVETAELTKVMSAALMH